MKKVLPILLMLFCMLTACTRANDNLVVFEDMRCTAGEEIWQAFYQKVSNGESASVEFEQRYTDEQGVTTHLGSLRYDGHVFTLKDPEIDQTYRYLMHYTGEPSSPYATFSHYEYYVLVNDDSVTWEDIEHGMFSSQFGDQIDHYTVYANLT